MDNKRVLGVMALMLVIFVVGFVLSIGLLQQVVDRSDPVSGHATSDSGNISITISTGVSITTADDGTINFTGCSAGGTIFSDVENGSDEDVCPSFLPDSILVRNDGGMDANVTLQASDWGEAHGGSFLDAATDDSWIAYKVSNSSSNSSFSGGCVGGFPQDWTNITDGNETLVCDTLLPDGVNNSVEFDVAIFIPESVETGENTLTLTFWASAVI
ncbi:MAG: hypothetical protein ACLFO2_03740 [Candidatus Woesearchaeota archaeon]